MNVIDIDRFSLMIPSEERNLKRLKFLKEEASKLRIAVFGKYNHGKSTLLNALIKQEIFKVADKRETLENKEYEHNDIIWVDTPGLDADVLGEDDREAMKGAFEIADILYLVHNVKAGELDKYEMKVFRELMKQDKNYHKKMFLILTQIDQVDSVQLEQVKAQINIQLPGLKTVCVSAQRYNQGLSKNQQKFIELSGMESLLHLVSGHFYELNLMRNNEVKRIVSEIKNQLNSRETELKKEINAVKYKQEKRKNQLCSDVELFVGEIKSKMES